MLQLILTHSASTQIARVFVFVPMPRLPAQEYWLAVYGDTSVFNDMVPACKSIQPAGDVKPWEAIWDCECSKQRVVSPFGVSRAR